jgi:C1A family cysteine protease
MLGRASVSLKTMPPYLKTYSETLNYERKGCREELWPYRIDQFAVEPPSSAYQAALQHRAILYRRVSRTLGQMKACLAEGYPWVFGFTVYESFETEQVARSGIVPMPGLMEKSLGGHAVMAVGYGDAQHSFLVRNSWGTAWGLRGYFKMPYAYFLDSNLSDDFWTIRLVA